MSRRGSARCCPAHLPTAHCHVAEGKHNNNAVQRPVQAAWSVPWCKQEAGPCSWGPSHSRRLGPAPVPQGQGSRGGVDGKGGKVGAREACYAAFAPVGKEAPAVDEEGESAHALRGEHLDAVVEARWLDRAPHPQCLHILRQHSSAQSTASARHVVHSAADTRSAARLRARVLPLRVKSRGWGGVLPALRRR